MADDSCQKLGTFGPEIPLLSQGIELLSLDSTLGRQGVAQLAQEEVGPGFVGGKDPIGLRLDGRETIVAPRPFGHDVALLREPRRPPAGTRHAHTEPGCRSMEGGALGHGRHDAQIDRQR